MTITMTEKTAELLEKLGRAGHNWGGTPMLDLTKSERGNLTQLKKLGLLTTFRENGAEFVWFYEIGLNLLLSEYQIDLYETGCYWKYTEEGKKKLAAWAAERAAMTAKN